MLCVPLVQEYEWRREGDSRPRYGNSLDFVHFRSNFAFGTFVKTCIDSDLGAIVFGCCLY